MFDRADHFMLPIALVGLVLLASGCGPRLRPVYPVKGEVVVGKDRKPAVGAIVFFNPVEKTADGTGMPVGTVDESGHYALTTRASNDGAPAGDYIITIVWPPARKSVFEEADDDRLRGAFADVSKSRHRYTVQPVSHNEVATIELP